MKLFYHYLFLLIESNRWSVEKIAILFIIIILSSCKSNEDGNGEVEFGQILFQVDVVNYAWGFHHSGFFIDNKGTVYCYDLDTLWSQEELTALLTDEIMDGMLQKAKNECGIVPLNKIDQMRALIPKISQGYMELPKNVMADAGITKYYYFNYNSRAGEYERIVFKQYGDWTANHSTPEGEELFESLQMISNGLQRN